MSFLQLTSKAFPLDEDNVDTDVIYPGRFLLRIDKKGAGDCLFYDKRFGNDVPTYVLDQPEFKGAEILLAGENFGCGSSREQAVWALDDFGIRCVIAKSFGEIFYSNCINNQILPITVSASEHASLFAAAKAQKSFDIDLQSKQIKVMDQVLINFDIAEQHQEMLIKGLDEIGLQLKNDVADIGLFETQQQQTQPWLWKDLA
ncbi:3-isopropylmalate dehydratase small subunit [Paraglaciecola sp. 2405UD69-4]|uniref:3-isopropylmalate dehydratase small subunit n=1 Tax=Paraglaciecola sp. 2405UD69-4 TaxID=3391836 RepID=UPI0039C92849